MAKYVRMIILFKFYQLLHSSLRYSDLNEARLVLAKIDGYSCNPIQSLTLSDIKQKCLNIFLKYLVYIYILMVYVRSDNMESLYIQLMKISYNQ